MSRRARLRLIASAGAVALAATGLAAAPAPAAEVETRPFDARSSDGTMLRGHVFLPKQAERPLATVLHFSPYFGGPGNSYRNTEEYAGTPEIAFLLDAGFALAAVSLRGTGRSDGCLRFGDEPDWRDGHAVIEAIAAQPWSNGRVGMYGHSYPAWSQFMAAATRPPALKAIVPTSGVIDLWSLLNRRGAPLTAGNGTAFAPLFTGLTGHQPPQAIAQLACPDLAASYRDNAENTVTGDRTDFFARRDLRAHLVDSPVATMTTIGIVSGINDGHILQHEGLWEILRPDRTRFVLGEWSHETPTAHKKGWRDQVVGWFDHYLRGGPQTVPPGVVEYQDDSNAWHTTDRWPPPSRTATVHLSGAGVVPDGEPVEPVRGTFDSADNDPGLKTAPPDEKTRLYNSTCGPHQLLFASRPLAEDTLLAGNFDADLTLTSSLPGGNLSLFLWRTAGSGACPDPTSSWFGRALMDLRHFETAGRSRDFPVGTPTRVRFRSHPMAALVRRGERIVVALGGGSSELEPDARHPRITVSGGTLTLPVATGDDVPGASALRFAPSPPCSRRSSPRTSYRRGQASFAASSRIGFRGRARDRGCGGGIRRVEVALARRSRKGPGAGRARDGRRLTCRFLNARARLGRSVSCARRGYIAARGTATWAYRLDRRLPRGHYKIWVRSVTHSGFAERVSRRNTRTFKVR